MTDGRSKARRRWPWWLSNVGILGTVVVVAGLGIVALVVMLQIAAYAPTVERPKLQIEALKYGLGVFAAAGAVAALLLAVRRQLLAEDTHDLALQTQAHTETDAAERRVTDLYTKAAEQLGSADAAVRLAGLYALERVAQNNPGQRQTIANVLCAYLRMPYTPPVTATPAPTGPITGLPLAHPAPSAARDPHQELQVRLTAQQILTTHLTLPPKIKSEQAATVAPSADQPFWPHIDLDLTGAHLVDWDMQRGHVHQATFTHVTFTGTAGFGEATFTGDAVFKEATFTATAWFDSATFTCRARFDGATFTGDAGFNEATFTVIAWFNGATFTAGAGFTYATFADDAMFKEATFIGTAWFSEATFASDGRFDEATFTADAVFREVTFTGVAVFGQVTFTDSAWFDGAAFTNGASFNEVTFTGDAWFDGAAFPPEKMSMANARVVLGESRRDVWPSGWRVEPDPSSGQGRLVLDSSSTPA